MRFQLGRSYSYLFAVYVLSVGAAMGTSAFTGREQIGFNLVIALTALLLLFLLASELRSGVALDSSWVARYHRSTPTFKLLVAWHAVAAICFAVFAVLAADW